MAVEHSNSQISRPAVDYDKLLRIGRELLDAIGEDVTRPGVVDTPRRFAAFWRGFIEYDPGVVDTVFEAVTSNQLVVVSGIRVWSLCEHHMLPFWCDVSIGYRAQDCVLGLSKFARVAHQHAHRLQVQERLTRDIAQTIQLLTDSDDVIVSASGIHLCMVMRGVKTDAKMTSVVALGAFESSSDLRNEFVNIVTQQ